MTETILPHQMADALDRAPGQVELLSLDCFDTLLWRDCHAPTDVFAALSHANLAQRIVGETRARKAERTLRQRGEVGLGAIWDHAMPNAAAAERQAAIAAELEAEARACFAFAPTVELMRKARARGIKVVLVSDTYLSATQLEALVRAAAGDEVADLVTRYFASSDAGISKSEGLLAKAIRAMKVAAPRVLHIGDNVRADFDASRALGVPALHLVQFSPESEQRLRLEGACQQIAGDTAADIRGLMPHRAIIAAGEPQLADPAERLGFTVLGPVLTAYDSWLRAEAEALQHAQGGTIHWLFMLRDGHLPHCIHQAGGRAASSIAEVEISRFTATAASLTDRAAYQRHLALEHGLNPATLARQMLIEEGEIADLIGDPRTPQELTGAAAKLLSELRSGRRQKLTRRRARSMADGLVAHVRAACDPQPGDTLMLVDLGYNGSAQNSVDALLSEAFDVHVAGRYLLLRETQASGLDKRGLIDARHFDPEFCEALCRNVAVIEQLATCELGSVTGYSEMGEPNRKQSALKGRQSAVRDRVQRGAVRFTEVVRADATVIRRASEHDERGWREGAAGVLARFMFLPQPGELETIADFEHDVNLGSERMVQLFDPAIADEGLRRRGLFYMNGSSRMFLPAEIAGHDMATRLSLLVQNRFGLGLTYSDHAANAIELPAYHVGASEGARTTIEAWPTHDGFYAARVPVARTGCGVALQFGAACEWIELATITCATIAGLKTGSDTTDAPVEISATIDAMEERGPGLFECTREDALVLITPDAIPQLSEPQMIEFVFRPLRLRGEAGAIIRHDRARGATSRAA